MWSIHASKCQRVLWKCRGRQAPRPEVTLTTSLQLPPLLNNLYIYIFSYHTTASSSLALISSYSGSIWNTLSSPKYEKRRQLWSALHLTTDASAPRPTSERAEDLHIPFAYPLSQVLASIVLSPLPICATSLYFHLQSSPFKTSSRS